MFLFAMLCQDYDCWNFTPIDGMLPISKCTGYFNPGAGCHHRAADLLDESGGGVWVCKRLHSQAFGDTDSDNETQKQFEAPEAVTPSSTKKKV